MDRTVVTNLIRFLVRVLTRTTVVGAENIPPQGTACLLTTNHMSRLDTPFLLVSTPRTDIIALVADKYKTNKFFAFLVKVTGSIWIDRDKADFAAFRLANEHLRKGGILGIAPEGTRSTTGELIEGKAGSVFLVEKARVPVVPVAITGSENAVREMLRLRRPRITVCFGAPYLLAPIDRDNREASLQAGTDEIMCRIAALLPEKYRGFYRDHPRLKELEEQS